MIENMKNDELNMFEIEIGSSRHVFLDERWKCSNACDSFSRLYYIRSGKGFLKYNGKTVEMKGGNVYLIPANCEFSYGCESLEKLYFHISILTVEKYDLLSGVNRICELPFSKQEFSKLLDCYVSDNYFDFLTLKMIIYKTVIDCCKKYGFKKVLVKEYSETVERIMTYIQKNAKINLSVSKISKSLFISESKIRKIFKEETGVTVGRYVDDLIFLKAKRLLGQKEYSIRDISLKLGFCDQFYFSRRFKEKYGKTPSEYRKELFIYY